MSAMQVQARMREIQNPYPTKTGSQHGHTFSQCYPQMVQMVPRLSGVSRRTYRNQSLFCTELNKQRHMDINLVLRWHSHVNNPFSNQRVKDGRIISVVLYRTLEEA